MKFFIFLFQALIFNVAFAQINSTPTGTLSNARIYHESQQLHNGMILVFGGYNGNATAKEFYNTAELYNPESGTWSYTGSMIKKRTDFSSVLLNDGRVFAIGGKDESGSSLASTEFYNPATSTWTEGPAMHFFQSQHKALKLKDGRVLVAGADRNVEIFDPETNLWQQATSMVNLHGIGFAMILMKDGNVLASGGNNDPRSLETYNPSTDTWTTAGFLSTNRQNHHMINLMDGKVLIVGGVYADIYNPITKTVNFGGYLSKFVSNSPMVLLENGHVLLYDIGDFFSPSDTKCFQIYNPSLNIWSSETNNLLGRNNYRINKLSNGKVLISGGMNNLLNEASSECLLVEQNTFSSCTPPNTNFTISGLVICKGNTSATLTLSGSESDVTYQPKIGDQYISSPITGNGGPLSFSVANSDLMTGNNVLVMEVKKSSCATLILKDTANVFVTLAAINKPDITPSGVINICSGTSVFLTASTSNIYLWSTNQTTSSISVSKGVYSIRGGTSDGCLGPISDPVIVNFHPSTVQAGNYQTICENKPSFNLTGFSPANGVWSGPGVSPAGNFNPGLAGPGTKTLTYSLCGITSSKTIEVYSAPKLQTFQNLPIKDSICSGATGAFKIPITQIGATYWLQNKNGTIVSYIQNGTGGPLTLYTPNLNTSGYHSFQIHGKFSNSCGNATQIEKDSVFVVSYPSAKVVVIPDTVCRGNDVIVKIANSEINIRYRVERSYATYTPYFWGNEDTLTINAGPVSYFYKVEAINLIGCTPLTLASKIVNDYKVNPDFGFSQPGFMVNDSVKLVPKSNGHFFNWSMDATASKTQSNLKNPAKFVYSTPGEKIVKLVTDSRFGCKDSTTRKLTIHPPLPEGNISKCNEVLYPGNCIVTDHEIDKHKNHYVTGYSANEMFSMKTDSLGKIIWRREHDALHPGAIYGTGITHDSKGNVYVIGHTSSTAIIGPFSKYASQYEVHMFVIKYDQQGKENWVIHGKSTTPYNTTSVIGSDIICDSNDRIYAAGHTINTQAILSFPDGTDQKVMNDCFIFEINSKGELKDFADFGSSYSFYASINGVDNSNSNYYTENKGFIGVNPKLALDNDGDLLVAGSFLNKSGAYSFGSSQLIGIPNESTSFIAKYNKVWRWKKVIRVADGGLEYIQAFAVDHEGNYYTSGGATNSIRFNGESISLDKDPSDKPYPYSYLVKSNADGSKAWHTLTRLSYIHDLSIAPNNNLYVTGFLNQFGSIYSSSQEAFGISAKDSMDHFVVAYSPNGQVLWGKSLGGKKLERPYKIKVDACGDFYISSLINRTYLHGRFPTHFTSTPGNISIAKYSTDGYCTKSNCNVIDDDINYDAGITNILPKDSVFSEGIRDVLVSLKNYGKNNLTTTKLYFQLDEQIPVLYNWSGNLEPGAEKNMINLGPLMFTAGKHILKVWSAWPEDVVDLISHNDSMSLHLFVCNEGLNGVYSIGKSDSDFNSFNLAVKALTYCGITGPVVFNVEDGVYNEQVMIPSINGSSSSNTVTFQSKSQDSTKVQLIYSGFANTINYTLKLNGADYFIFKNLGIISKSSASSLSVIELTNGADNNIFLGNHIQASDLSLYGNYQWLLSRSGNISNNGNTIEANYFENGHLGIVLGGYGPRGYGTSDKDFEQNTIILRNKFYNQLIIGASITNVSNVKVSQNEFRSQARSDVYYLPYTGINCDIGINNTVIEQNTITYLGTPSGILEEKGTGIQYTGNSNYSQYNGGMISNNLIYLNCKNATGIYVEDWHNLKIYNNTSTIKSSNGTCLFIMDASKMYIQNNNLTNLNQGFVFDFNNVPFKIDYINTCDFNNVYVANGNIGRSFYTNYLTLNSWQTASGLDSNSLSVLPRFAQKDDCHILEDINLIDNGRPVEEITTDVDGEARIGNPDIGADEFKLATYQGTISNSNGSPIKNSRVYALKINNDNSILYLDSTTTNENGHYSLSSSTPVYLMVKPNQLQYPNEVLTYYKEDVAIQDATVVKGNQSNLNFSTFSTVSSTASGSINGNIYYDSNLLSDKLPAGGIRVLLVNGTNEIAATVYTKSDGKFTFDGLKPDTYSLWIDFPEVDNTIAPQITITSTNSTFTNLSFTLHSSFLEWNSNYHNGIITNSNGLPLKNSMVYAVKINTDNKVTYIDSSKTDENGYYNLFTVAPFYLMAKPDPLLYPNEILSYYVREMVIQEAELITNNQSILDFSTFHKREGSTSTLFSGSIYHETNLLSGIYPVANLRILVINSNSEIAATLYTDADGNFICSGLELGNYILWVDKPGIDNYKAPKISLSITNSSLTNLIFKLHSDHLELTPELTAVNNHTSNYYSVYPNPFSREFTVRFSDHSKRVKIDIFSSTGKFVKSEIIYASSLTKKIIVLEDPGFYLLKIEVDNKVFLTPIVGH